MGHIIYSSETKYMLFKKRESVVRIRVKTHRHTQKERERERERVRERSHI
jgi:hypothetical protein